MELTTKSPSDSQFMQRCLQLARQADGKTSPNPLVGSVIVKEGQVLGEGFHPEAGKPHAEVFALRAAGDRAKDATLYVNLEPCNHTGRTPPCTEAIIAAGISRVVIGNIDPDPRVSGSGVNRLRQAGLDVVVGVEEADCRRVNEVFIHSVKNQRPFGILKYAMTLDGKIAASSGHSAWVTGKDSRAWVHRLRSRCDAVIVGGQTVRQDNPRLTSHGQSDRNPLRVVMTRSLDLPDSAHLWQTDMAKTLVFCSRDRDASKQHLIENQGVEVIDLAQLEPLAVLEKLHERGLRSVLWECGGRLSAQAIAQNCVQKVFAFVAPKIIGGATAPGPIGDLGHVQMTEAIRLTDIAVEQIASDLLIQGYLNPNRQNDPTTREY
ncbi:bifunctional diaminohydroxyphosphoribosylaminopyrimidine deaminase/5-amino-6-(5-phosphoribosylamino)uracil reductase RibD [Oscillatoria sp. CS-180]|uniref:bifunctional diaminohydroxyphosphoribosylaminopyrimidine deaminase/5-amino-6-(5-phosphoribosylamino)uracil reductase RibD n=1 Tax=Oscillatoria sp. CS-180 TaxID=3021720 RepID=UPI00232F4DAA|nr:bifunctional diaminohydroxyphosphoribosylaminopyrimidine deaminase/5-amino-6-(5-phosphoribosylamino)uracil reductase RibD [Oscillatoria sp. CS-180]MDB9524703.1 bifunctional diaminohydroxyphosphoribosylaminopyrimidine deaminase/5-amino-6-(5-phosphoribosylamino)uracil reductase RibD [Oscillatoria sp. CS-180]